jgi:peptidyl-prolyl cis-trans isomerase SurA
VIRNFIVAGLAICLATAAAQAAEVFNRVAAVVDNDVITLHEIETMAAPVIAENLQKLGAAATDEQKKKSNGAIKQQILQGLIEQKLIESEVRRLGIEVTDQEIDAYAQRVRQANNYTDETLKLALQRQGLTMQDFRERIKKEILREQYVSFRMRDKLKVRDEDVQAYYEHHPDEFAGEPIVHIAEIRVNAPPDANEEQLKAILAGINAVYEKLLGGADFAETARECSKGPTAADGGVLGDFKIDSELQPVYHKAVAPLKPGEFSTIYRDRNGFVILKLLDKKTGVALPFEEVKEKISMMLRKQQADTEMDRLGAELRKKSYVDVRVNFENEK